MNQQKKKEFILSLIQNVQASILKDVERMPEEWDGHELRRLIGARFTSQRFGGGMGKRRVAEYNNTLAVANL